jgi:thiamine-phosphate pyrophosphorylase
MDIKAALKLYVIPDLEAGAPLSLEEQTERALLGGATMIQLRNKEMSGRALYETAVRLVSICRRHAVPLIVNDRFDIALAAGADGVHLGNSDLPADVVKKLVPLGFLIGATAHSLEEGRAAENAGADYVGIGAAFPSDTKKGASVLGTEGIRMVRSALSIPSVAIGGINPSNAKEVLETGVDGIAVVASVVGQKDVVFAAACLAEIVSTKKAEED